MVTPKGDEDIKENSIQQYRNQNTMLKTDKMEEPGRE